MMDTFLDSTFFLSFELTNVSKPIKNGQEKDLGEFVFQIYVFGKSQFKEKCQELVVGQLLKFPTEHVFFKLVLGLLSCTALLSIGRVSIKMLS